MIYSEGIKGSLPIDRGAGEVEPGRFFKEQIEHIVDKMA